MNSSIIKLETLIDNERSGQNFTNYSLKDISFLLRHFGNPHKKIKTVHIAGTNGKGSTAHMLNSISITAGYKTGLYTSPNLIRINERIKINNREITNQKLSNYIEELFEVLARYGKVQPTYFDALTFIAFRYFFDEKTDLAIIETGLGGRLDSTNVISPLVSIITNISMDHTGVLGSTVNEITLEKAGIIKKKSITITSNTDNEILKILENTAGKMESAFYAINRDFFIKIKKRDSQTFDFSINSIETPNNNSKKAGIVYSMQDINIKIPGRFQIINASLAVASSFLLKKHGYEIGEYAVKKGLENTLIPGRMEILCNNPLIIFDPAHNPEAMKTTVSELKKIYPGRNYTAVVSFMTDKDYLSMFRIIRNYLTENIIYFELPDKRSFKLSNGKPESRKPVFNNIISVNNINDLYNAALKTTDNNSLFFITGSFRLYGIGRKLIKLL